MRSIPILLAALWAPNALSSEVTPYIVNGTDISASAYPDFVSLFYDRIDYDGVYGSGPYCGGTLLSSQYVLTAAHCIYGDNNYQLFTSVVPQLQNESDFPNSVQQRVMVSEYYYRSDYNDTTLANDIAILKLAQPITAVAAYADLAVSGDESSYRVTPSQAFYAVGHGNTQTNVDASEELQRTQLSYVTNADCANVYRGADTSENLCMTGAATVNFLDNATCQGDSGGPLYWGSKQVGITSFGPQTCGDTGITPNSVFTEVSHHEVWINSVLNGNETPKVTVTDNQRNSALNPSSGGGGSIGMLLLAMLGFLGWKRASK